MTAEHTDAPAPALPWHAGARAALAFFTRIPLRAPLPGGALAAALAWFPAVGVLVGTWAAVLLLAVSTLWPATVAVPVALVATLWLTGALHEDGWADCCDGLAGGRDAEHALAIMRDPHCGSFAMVGLVSLLGLKALALIELAFISPLVAASALLAAHPLSRLAALQISDHLPYARAGSVSRASALVAPGHGQRAVALLAGLLPLLLLPWQQALLLPIIAVLTVAWAARLFRSRLGGYTGDCLGATQQAVETLCYLTLTASWNFI